MFRKLVSNLAFSPALVGQLAFYAKRLKKEETTRRLGLVFTVLALIVQSFAVFSPPESANASSANSFISGGFSSKTDFLKHYDANRNNIKDLFNAVGITRKNIQDSKLGEVHSKSGVYSWGLKPHFSSAQGEKSYTVKTSSGSTRKFYYRPLKLWDTGNNKKTGSYYQAYVGKTSNGTWFALLKICGNLVLKTNPPKPKCPNGTVGTYPDCKKPSCPDGTTGTYPDCKKPEPKPVAACDLLRISVLTDNRYQFDTTASTANGAKISKYTYTVKRSGGAVNTIPINSTSSTNSYVYTQSTPGAYTVTVTVSTSLGDKTSSQCASSFTVAQPTMCPQNPSLKEDDPLCQPCPGDETIWIKDSRCESNIIETKSATNSTQSKNAPEVVAGASDAIVYSLNLENKGLKPATYSIEEHLDDVLEYATVIDAGGGTLTDKTLTWPTITLGPGEKQTRMFSVKILDKIPAMPTGADEKTSYDCRINNTFGNNVSIAVACPPEKVVVEEVVKELPHTGPTENMIFAGATLSIVSFFYARTRLMKKEVRLIRRDLNAGTI